jgi:Spy/CpxP family protein refolding chaperone
VQPVGACRLMKGLFLVLFVCLFLASPLFAQRSYREMENDLMLSESQRAQMQDIRNRYYPGWEEIQRESIRRRLELRELERDPMANAERISRLRNEMRDLQSARSGMYNQYSSEVSRSLNQRQRAQYQMFINRERRNMPGPLQAPGHYYGPGPGPRYMAPGPGPHFGPGPRYQRRYGR